MVRSDWSKRWPDKERMQPADGKFPGATLVAEDWLMNNGYMQAEGVANLDQVPATGALVAIGFPRLKGGTGGLRISGDKMPEADYPRAVYRGSEFLVTWSAYGIYAPTPESGIFGARVSPAGAVNRGGDSYGIALSGEPTGSRYVHGTPLRLGSRHVVTWVDGTSVRDLPIYSLD